METIAVKRKLPQKLKHRLNTINYLLYSKGIDAENKGREVLLRFLDDYPFTVRERRRLLHHNTTVTRCNYTDLCTLVYTKKDKFIDYLKEL